MLFIATLREAVQNILECSLTVRRLDGVLGIQWRHFPGIGILLGYRVPNTGRVSAFLTPDGGITSVSEPEDHGYPGIPDDGIYRHTWVRFQMAVNDISGYRGRSMALRVLGTE